jgi:hypothetical protein
VRIHLDLIIDGHHKRVGWYRLGMVASKGPADLVRRTTMRVAFAFSKWVDDSASQGAAPLPCASSASTTTALGFLGDWTGFSSISLRNPSRWRVPPLAGAGGHSRYDINGRKQERNSMLFVNMPYAAHKDLFKVVPDQDTRVGASPFRLRTARFIRVITKPLECVTSSALWQN